MLAVSNVTKPHETKTFTLLGLFIFHTFHWLMYNGRRSRLQNYQPHLQSNFVLAGRRYKLWKLWKQYYIVFVIGIPTLTSYWIYALTILFKFIWRKNWLPSEVLTLKSHLPFDNGSQPNWQRAALRLVAATETATPTRKKISRSFRSDDGNSTNYGLCKN